MRQAPIVQAKINSLLDVQQSALNALNQELKIKWFIVFVLDILGCLFAVAGSILLMLFARRSQHLLIAEKERSIALEKAEEGNKIKHEFLTIVSHELKTYLNAITGLTNLIQDRNKDIELKDDLEMLRLSNQGMKSIIDNSIDLGDIEMGSLVLNNQSINLSKYLKGVVHSFIPSAQQNQVDIQLDYDENIPLEVEGDPFRLNQILFNLIKNAIKFGKNGRVIVSIKLVSIEVNQAKIRFNVIDNGIGIASVEVDKIFKSFSHANEAIMENYGGSGIGLSLTCSYE